MHRCKLSLVSKDSPKYSIIWLIEILIIGMFSLMILGMGGVSCYGAWLIEILIIGMFSLMII